MTLRSFERVEKDVALAASARPWRGLAVRGHRILVDAGSLDPIFIGDALVRAGRDVPFLGLDENGAPVHALVLSEEDDPSALARLELTEANVRFVDPRMELGRYVGATREAVLTALALARWSAAERFCSACGRELAWDAGSRTKVCANPARAHRHFPRTDPATIVLVTDGDRVLLGRQTAWPPGLYSTLAGFVEAGETIEAAVEREIIEEVGVRVSDVRYRGSEAWPFPRSLMLGFEARATTTEIRIGDELEDARWFERAELAELQREMHERMPHFDTIARRLMRGWLERPREL